MEIEYKKLLDQDVNEFIQLIRVFEEVFEMQQFLMPDRNHLAQVLAKNDFLVFVAMQERTVIAGLTVYVLHQYYNSKPLAYIYDLAVLPQFQRQGIGSRLISETKLYCTQQGFEEVFVQADKADGYALDFYRATRPSNEEQVVHFYYTL
ncbi:GNAT family N-acetyltransferase [Pontibacter sp. 13R65]|uniref:GNAT family N-acetyltransferase n=1 Tax=Pontibacter sp. 13R65 TaxID=3127458 RepID=UPI00301BC6F2